MASRSGVAVGVTVVPIDAGPSSWEPADPDPAPQSEPLGQWLPRRRSSAQAAAFLQQITAAEAKLAALRLELVLDIAAARPAPSDPRPGRAAEVEHGPAGTSEFVLDELALIMGSSRDAAVLLLDQAHTLTSRLPLTCRELAAGRLDWPRARAIAAELGRPADGSDPAVVEAVEAAVLPVAADLSIRRLRELVHRELVARDTEANDRRRKQARDAADVTVRRIGIGMSELRLRMQHQEAVACRRTLDAHARTVKDAGDRRPIGVLRVGAGLDRMLRPWQEQPRVTAHLTVVAPLGALTVGAFLDSGAPLPAAFRPARPTERAPIGDVDGEAITATHLRELLEQLDALCPGGLQAPTGGTLDIALTGAGGRLLAVIGRRELERRAHQGCPAHPDERCGCPALTAPPAVSRYSPSAGQRRFVSARDRTCRHPGCHVRAGWADLDHVVAHADGGATDCVNLCCLCRRHHRLRTHADGWTHTLDDDGVLTVVTPSGVTRTTRPPGLRIPEPDDPPPF
ncbi:HNH endonuclease [Blastococcus sp. TF02-09]|uniref:HNH endonuclease signature motif containing protein n=1 Tax=Blastococcus sp. TF02-09 TaxID=2250576 RepID=UPI000DEA0C83|nr:HNH endonuclease signature motif containing protein [Blastococcus sp. TF02-9]RBY79089.1 HNH endonuclease [Blastococcus sp. TF02-9]